MKILLVGSGGREHALALGLQADPACTELHCAPGNPGTSQIATNHLVAVTDNAAIVELAKEFKR
jgi:phosphoribosylamine---glycine ligase